MPNTCTEDNYFIVKEISTDELEIIYPPYHSRGQIASPDIFAKKLQVHLYNLINLYIPKT